MCLETQFLDFDIYSTLSICPISVWCGLILASFTTAINDHLQTVKVGIFDADGARLNEGTPSAGCKMNLT